MRRYRFTLLTRPGCHLCCEMEAELLSAYGDAIEVEPVHVDAHPHWQAAYGLQIPVLLDAEERFVCAVQIDYDAVDALLAV